MESSFSKFLKNIIGISGIRNISIIEEKNGLIIQDVNHSEITVIQQIDGLDQAEIVENVVTEVLNFFPQAPRSIDREINEILIAQPKKVFGREEEIEFITNSFKETNSLLLVSGIAGIGKSVTAYHYYKLTKHLYKHVCWFNGSDDIEERLFNDAILHTNLNIYEKTRPYLSPGAIVSDSDRKNVLATVTKALKNLDPKVLFIVDDCAKTNFETIKKLQANLENCHFLITSRNKSVDFIQKELGVLPLKKAIELFYNFYSLEKADQVISEIIDLLQGHTLLIELVSKAAQRAGFPLIKILNFLTDGFIEHQGLQIKVDINELRENREVESEEFIISYIKILLKSILTLTDEEKSIISDLSLLPNYPIEKEKIIKLISGKKKESTEDFKLVNDLADKGYIQVTDEVIQIHSLVGTATREHIQIHLSDKKNLIDNFLNLIPFDSTVNDIDAFKSYNNIGIGDSMLKHLPLPTNFNEVEYYGRMQNQIARIYNLFRNHDRAINLFQDYLYLLDKHGKDFPKVQLLGYKVSVTSNLAGAYMKKGLHVEAKNLLNKVIQEQRDKSEFISPQLLSSLGNACIELGSYNEALNVLIPAKKLAASLYGPNSSAVAEASHNIGIAYHLLGKSVDAKKHLDDAKTIFENLYGPNHRSTIQSEISGEKVAIELGEHESAITKLESKYKELIDIDSNHPMIESVANDLATAYRMNGDYKKAIEVIENTIEFLSEKHGNDFHLVYTLKSNASIYYEKDGQLEKAAIYAEEGLKYLQSKYPGKSSPHLAGRLSNLAVIYNRLGKIDEALKLYEQAVEIDSESEVSDVEKAILFSNMGSLYTHKKNFEKAFEFHHRAIDIFINNGNTESPDFAITQSNMGETLYYSGHPYKAYKCFKKSLSIGKKIFHSNHPKLITRNGNIRNALIAIGCYFTAYEYAVESSRISSEIKGDTIETAFELSQLADVQYHIGRLAESAVNTKRAADILVKYNDSQVEVAKLIATYLERGQQAIEHKERKSIPTAEKVGGLKFIDIAFENKNESIREELIQLGLKGIVDVYGEDNPYAAEAYEFLSFRYHQIGEYENALENLANRYELLKKVFGEKHHLTVEAFTQIGFVQISLASQMMDEFRNRNKKMK